MDRREYVHLGVELVVKRPVRGRTNVPILQHNIRQEYIKEHPISGENDLERRFFPGKKPSFRGRFFHHLIQIDENDHDGPHVRSESQVVITTDTCPIDSRALGVGWVAWFGFPCYGPALRVGRTKKKSRGRARAIATTGVLCPPALGKSDTYPAVSGGAGGAENRNAPNDTAALSFLRTQRPHGMLSLWL